MTRDRRELQSWYREAMLRRIDELVDLRPEIEEGSSTACDRLRAIAQALRGSGGTFGFPELSAAAGRVETTTDAEALRRLEGLIVELRRLVGGMRDEASRVFEWLALCATSDGAPSATEADEALEGATTVEAAWKAVARISGQGDSALAEGIARRFTLEVADLTGPSRAARRLVPEAFMAYAGVVPLAEDRTTITVASADPVSLSVQLELERLTGRRPVYAVASPSAIASVLGSVDESDSDRAGIDGARQEPSRGESPRPPAVEAEVIPGTGATGGGSVEVLVVDDDEGARLLVRSLLEKKGLSTVDASDGLEALEVVRRNEDIGLVVVDLNMPRMDGLELMWRLRDAREWNELPVIVVTGEDDEIIETRIMEEGADDYIRKPLDPRLFLARVHATLRRAGRAPVD